MQTCLMEELVQIIQPSMTRQLGDQKSPAVLRVVPILALPLLLPPFLLSAVLSPLMHPEHKSEVSEKISEPKETAGRWRERERERGLLNIELRLSPVLLNSHKKAAGEPTA